MLIGYTIYNGLGVLVSACWILVMSVTGLFQSSTSMMGTRARSKVGSCLMFQNSLCWSWLMPPCQRSSILIPSQGVNRVAGSQQEGFQMVPLTLRRRRDMADVIPDEFQSSSSSSVVQVGTLPEFLDQWKSNT